MSDRRPNEVLISVELLQELFQIGDRAAYRIKQGPSALAQIVGARMDALRGLVVLEYSEPVDDVIAVTAQPA